MNQPNGNILIANGIVNLEGSKELCCSLCSHVACYDNWINHIETCGHAIRLERFESIFQNRKTSFYCTICTSNFNWNMLKIHAIEHKLVPWYVPEDRYKIFFENHILETWGRYYCYPCDKVFLHWTAAFVHTNEKVHRKRLAAEQPENKSFVLASDVSHKTFVYNALISWNNTNIACKICNCFNIGIPNVVQHVEGSRHKSLKYRLIGVLKDRRNRELAAKRLIDNDISSIENKYRCNFCKCLLDSLEQVSSHIDGDGHKCLRWKLYGDKLKSKNKPINDDFGCLLRNYIVQQSETNFYCTICSCVITNRTNIADHVSGKRHATVQTKFHENKITFVKDENYHCNFCDCNISSPVNVSSHIDGNRHKIAITKHKELAEVVKTPENSCTTKQLSTYHCIVEFDETRVSCKICSCLIVGYDNIEQHVTGTRHAGQLKRFNENKIEFVEKDVYHCKYCDWKIFDRRSLDEHIKGIKHHRALNANEPKINRPEVILQSVSRDFIMKMNNDDSLCRICDCNISRGKRGIDEHVVGRVHANALQKYGCNKMSLPVPETKDYHCKSCDCKVAGIENLCRHVKGHRHAISLKTTADEVSNETKIAKSSTTLIRPPNHGGAKKIEKLPNERTRLRPSRNSRQRYINVIWKQQIRMLRVSVNCNICDLVLANIVELHSHVAVHFNEDFVARSKAVDPTNFTNDNKKLTKSLNLSDESYREMTSDDEYFDCSETTEIELKKSIETDRVVQCGRTSKKLNIKRIIDGLNFEKNYIYSMTDKLCELELGMKLCCAIDSQNTYCLVCQRIVDCEMENYYEHLSTLDHSVYLERMERDHALFEKYPEQLSAIDLGLECMEEISNNVVSCHVCVVAMKNNDDTLRNHFANELHRQACLAMRNAAMKIFRRIKLRLFCDWYMIERYRCVPCLLTFGSEVNFAKHLESNEHSATMDKPVNAKRQIVFDFCEACALLWYGYRRTGAYHREIDTHIWLTRDKYYTSVELPKRAKELLAEPECYVNEMIENYDFTSDEERIRENRLIRNMEDAVGWKYNGAKAYSFGSRVTGVGSSDSDIDVFLDCGNMYDGKMSTSDEILKFMDGVFKCLSNDPHSWSVEELLKTCRSPIIKVYHRPTGLSCDISFENGLAVENTNLIKYNMLAIEELLKQNEVAQRLLGDLG